MDPVNVADDQKYERIHAAQIQGAYVTPDDAVWASKYENSRRPDTGHQLPWQPAAPDYANPAQPVGSPASYAPGMPAGQPVPPIAPWARPYGESRVLSGAGADPRGPFAAAHQAKMPPLPAIRGRFLVTGVITRPGVTSVELTQQSAMAHVPPGQRLSPNEQAPSGKFIIDVSPEAAAVLQHGVKVEISIVPVLP
jgi:hypothetical protein